MVRFRLRLGSLGGSSAAAVIDCGVPRAPCHPRICAAHLARHVLHRCVKLRGGEIECGYNGGALPSLVVTQLCCALAIFATAAATILLSLSSSYSYSAHWLDTVAARRSTKA